MSYLQFDSYCLGNPVNLLAVNDECTRHEETAIFCVTTSILVVREK